ncbi:MAG: glucose 1-dehydrogenase [Blastocatellia bacterium]|nr:glucose 1-dehydrogenase [Blastocatellia bacterium]
MKNLEGKVAIVTGGSSGIGKAASIAFAKAGARVVIAARGAQRGEEVAHQILSSGGKAVFVRSDLSNPNDIEVLIKTAVDKYGRLDCAFNNAAIAEGSFAFIADFTEEEFDRTINVNLKGVWLCMKHEIRQMLQQTPAGGAIVNTSSVNGLGGAPQGALYSASKAGVLALTKSAAQEYGQQGIRVNALVAGAFRTPMLELVFEKASGGDPEAKPAVEEKYRQFIAMGRIGLPEEAAEAVVWLCSDAASYVTGHSMIVDGGMTAAVR